MFTIKPLHELILVLMLAVLAISPNDFCSAFCEAGRCNGPARTQCDNGKCNSNINGRNWGWSWDSSSDQCVVTDTDKMLLDISEDAGGNMVVSPTGGTQSCNYGPGLLANGVYTARQTITITQSGGSSQPFYALNIIFDLTLIDVDSNTATKQWQSNPRAWVALLGTTTNTSNDVSGSKSQAQQKNICGTNKKDRLFLIMNYFMYNQSGGDIVFQLKMENNQPLAQFQVKQFSVVLYLCSTGCLTCNNTGTTNVCFSCDASTNYKLSNYTCDTSCRPGFGATYDPALCVFCNLYCLTCFDQWDNCYNCTTSGPYQGFLYFNPTMTTSGCLATCPNGTYPNSTDHVCYTCDLGCITCQFNSSHCYSCDTTLGYAYYRNYCYMTCPASTFLATGGTNCSNCNNTCIMCTDQVTCSSCTLNGGNKAFLLGVLCFRTCPTGYYGDDNFGSGPNICSLCNFTCATCTGYPSPCQSCITGYYLYQNTCINPCPTGYITYTPTLTCQDCTTFCIDLTIDMYFPSSGSYNDQVYIDMIFSKDIDYATFNHTGFQTVSISGVISSAYSIAYTILDSKSYRITVSLIGYVFLYNETVSVVTKDLTGPVDLGANSTPFKQTNYAKSGSLTWYIMKSPSLSQNQIGTINSLASVSTFLNAITTSPGMAQVKKSGVLAMLFSGAQMTSLTLHISSVPSQNRYQATRFWGTMVFYDVPKWQQTSDIKNRLFSKQDFYQITKDNRRLQEVPPSRRLQVYSPQQPPAWTRQLFDLTSLYWRYQRTGITSFFILDVYIPLLMIVGCWIGVLVVYSLRRCCDVVISSATMTKLYTVFHKVHQLVIMYVTMAMMLEWLYFDAGSLVRWVSLIVCLTFTCYFIGYHLFIYYDMMDYPSAAIGNAKYEYYLTRYSCFLKNIRFDQHQVQANWSPRQWFRPYNYHILSYYKKFCMIISLAIFYDFKHIQLYVLIILQSLQMARFLATKPYHKKWRNVYKFVLQCLILLFFLQSLVESYLIEQIVAGSDVQSMVDIYYILGWVGFVIVFAFNIGYFVLFVINFVVDCKYSGRQMVELARRQFYYDKITDYQRDGDQVPIGLMNRWVKLGNLNKRDMAGLPSINVRIQQFKVTKFKQYFDVQVFKITQLFMNTDFNFHQENNTTAGHKIKKRIKLSRDVSPAFYQTLTKVYAQYPQQGIQNIILKTFVRVEQNTFKAGDRIPMLPAQMFMKIQLEMSNGQKQEKRLATRLEGFPINAHQLEKI